MVHVTWTTRVSHSSKILSRIESRSAKISERYQKTSLVLHFCFQLDIWRNWFFWMFQKPGFWDWVVIHGSRASRCVSLTNWSTIPPVKSLFSVHLTAVKFKCTNGQYQTIHVRGGERPAVHKVDCFSKCKSEEAACPGKAAGSFLSVMTICFAFSLSTQKLRPFWKCSFHS